MVVNYQQYQQNIHKADKYCSKSKTNTCSHHIPLFGEGQRSWDWQHAAWLGGEGALLLAADNEVLARPGPPAKWAPLLRLTTDASPGGVYNGVSDFLYQGQCLHPYMNLWLCSHSWNSGLHCFLLPVNRHEQHMSEYWILSWIPYALETLTSAVVVSKPGACQMNSGFVPRERSFLTPFWETGT